MTNLKIYYMQNWFILMSKELSKKLMKLSKNLQLIKFRILKTIKLIHIFNI